MKDATGQALAYVYGRERQNEADTAHTLTIDEARRIASNIAEPDCPIITAAIGTKLTF